MPAKINTTFNTQHADLVHDVQFDYYGSQLATCSSDHNVNVFQVSNGEEKLAAQLQGHTSPVWKISWSHPRFALLASCSYDGAVIVWKQDTEAWTKVKIHKEHKASVNSVCFYPSSAELCLACASSDGKISVLSFDETTLKWSQNIFDAHSGGVNTVAWLNPKEGQEKTLVSGGCDCTIRFWAAPAGEWKETGEPIRTHTDWVCDAEVAPEDIFDTETIASCGHDKTVFVHKRTAEGWRSAKLQQTFTETVWRVSWSSARTVLAVCCGDGVISFWKSAKEDGEWQRVDETGNVLSKHTAGEQAGHEKSPVGPASHSQYR
ncbi:MAG: protein transporter SEC13 [Amphiamblys sp. WSBS2006]|nr:MAG: protein transporter SEC13 [Amphiamblys sp. WSBS2006]